MSYWWDGQGGAWDGCSWGGGYIDASGSVWGNSLFDPIDQSLLPGFGTNWGSWGAYAEAQYDAMVERTLAVNGINNLIASGQLDSAAVQWLQGYVAGQDDPNVLSDLNRFLHSLPPGAHYIGEKTWGVPLPDGPDGTIRSQSITFNPNHSFAAYWNEQAQGWFIGDQFISADMPTTDGSYFDINRDPNAALTVASAELMQFGARGIGFDVVRQQYAQNIEQMSQEILDMIARGEITPEEGARRANELRNTILEMSRGQDSELGRAIAEFVKREGLTLESLMEKYATRTFGTNFHNLTGPQQDQVFLEIVRAAGRDNPRITAISSQLGRAGTALLIIGIGISIYNVATAEDKLDAAGREGFGLAGGWLGGAAGGAAAGLICGPGAPICSGIGIIVGGIIGAYGGTSLWDWWTSDPNPTPPPDPDPGGGGGGDPYSDPYGGGGGYDGGGYGYDQSGYYYY